MTRQEVSPSNDPFKPPAEEGEEENEQAAGGADAAGAGPSSQQAAAAAAEDGVYVKPEPLDHGAPGPSTGPMAGGSQGQDGEGMRHGRKVPSYLLGVVNDNDDLKPRCE
jgi:hypothetical protein